MSKVFKNNPQQSKLILEELEERRLFSGGIEGLIASDLDSEAQAIYADADKAKAANANDETSVSAAEQQTQEIVFVDAGVDNYQQLVDDLHNNADSSRNIEVVVLDRDKDGIEEISEFLSHRENLDAIHIISHGSDGSVELGNTSLNADTLEQNNLKIALWANSFDEAGDILIYGCNLAETGAGQSLINDLSALTLTDVAASTDLTGDASQGGDWALEFSVGQVESKIAVSAELQQEYQGTFATYTVTSLADSGAGSLREAITLANTSGGADAIEFSVAGTINLSSALPSIAEELAIDGSTAPGYSGDPVVNLDGSGVSGNGLRFTSGADNSSVNALMITNFTGNGIQIDSGADGITITGNWIGTTGTGTTGDGNSNNGINVQGANTVIGGTGANEGNVITSNGNEGINLTGSGATGTIIQGNIIGLDPDGSTGSGNGDVGIALLSGAHNTTIGGTDPNAGNVISMNFEGIEINSNNNTVQGNYIGTDITGTLDRGNDSDDGIEIKNNATGNLIGGTEEGAGNLIAYNLLDGVNIVSGSGNTVLGNDIHSNGDQDIDLAAGVNNDQAAPLLASAQTSGSELTVSGSLSSTANSYFRIEFFGANQTYLGFVNVATDGSGNATFETTLSVSVASGTLVTANATKSDATYTSFTDTSAYSSAVVSGNAGTAIWRDASTTPQTSAWDGSSFGSTTASAPSGDYRIMQGAEAPTRDEIIVIGVDESSQITGEIWDGNSWSILPGSLGSPLGTVDQNYWWGMDVQYESQSGDALIVWADGANIEYATWDGSSWSGVNTITYSGATPRQLQLAASPGSDEMVLVVSDSNSEDYALVWNGSSWGNEQILEQVAGDDRTDIFVTYEQQSGHAMVVYGKTGTDAYYRIWNGSSWEPEGSVSQASGASGNLRWTTLASDPNSDRIALGVTTSNGDTWLNVWDGSGWGTSELATTTATGTNHPAVAVAFESSSGELLAAYGESGSSNVKYQTWTAGGGWSGEQIGPNVGGTPNSLMLASDPISDQIMLTAQDSNSHVNYVLWNGSSWGTPTELGTSTTETKNQPFLFLWDQDTPNQAPVNNLPAAQSTDVDTTLTFNVANGNLISISNDPGNTTTVTLSVDNGTLTLAQTTGLTIDAGADGSATMTVTGTVEDINAALDGLQYTPTTSYVGGDTLTVVSSEDGTQTLDIDSNLLGRYQFEAAAPGDDGSPGGTNGATLFGDAAIATDPERGDVVSLDGSGDYAEIAGLYGEPADITLSAWVDLTGTSRGELINIGDRVILRADDILGAGVKASFYNGSGFSQIESGQFISGTGWHHLAFSFDDVANTQTLYIDGIAVATENYTDSIDYSGGQADTRIGRSFSNFSPIYFQGSIDDARIYERALTASEIADLAAERTSDSDSLAITVNPVNDAPTLVSNTGLTAAEGSTTVITNVQLGYTDAQQPASSVVYTLTTVPANGQLELTTNPDVAITSFTQAQVDAGEVVYVHDGSETTADGFGFTVDDGQGHYASGPAVAGIGPLTNVTNGISNARAPDYSPDGSQVVFARNNDIYIMDADGSNQTPLVTDAGGDFQAVWSPDGSKIAYTTNRDGNNEIYVIDVDGNNDTRLTTDGASDSAPAWSPDGTKIAFTSDRDGDKEIWVMDADGNNLVQLTSNTAIDGGASWSPDGSKIVFQSMRDGNYEIYVMDADGNNQSRLTSDAGLDALGDWSPDGSKLLFYSDRDGNNEIYVMDADGNNQVRLTNDAGDDIEAEWSPDGSSILFSSNRDGDYDIYSANVIYENTLDITVTAVNDAPAFIDGAFGNWNFDEGSGDSVAESAIGISGGTLGSTAGADANDPTWTSGVFGQALHFDGVDDYVEIADAPGIDISGPQFSASLWMNPDSGPNTEDMLFMKGDRQGNVNYYLSWKDSGVMTWAFKDGAGWHYQDMPVTTMPATGQWNHIGITFDRPTVTLYVNGDKYVFDNVATGGSMDNDLTANDEVLWIGAGRDGGSLVGVNQFSGPFSGSIDELALFDRALTDADMEAIRTSAPPVVTASAFSLDENSVNNTVVGTVAAYDPDVGDSLSYAITAGNTGGAFSIDANGVITVANSAALDFETNPVFNLTVEATDDGSPNLSDSTSVTITLNAVNEGPTAVADAFVVNEDTPTNLDLLANDADPENDTLTLLGFERVIASYDAGDSGSAPDPTSAAGGSWTFEDTEDGNGATGTATVGGVSPDGATGQNGWNVTDANENVGEFVRYDRLLTLPDATLASTNGFTLSAELRMVDDFGDTRSTFIRYGDGSTRFVAWFDLDANGDLVVELGDDFGGQFIQVTDDGSGADAYHRYEIVYDGGTGTAAFLVDGVRRDDGNWAGETSTFAGLRWGVGSAAGQGSANFHSVQMAVYDQSITTAGGATVTNNGDGTVNYAPTTNFTGADNFTYTMRDSEGHLDSASVAVNVASVADGIRVTPLSLAPIGGETLVNTTTANVQTISAGVPQAMATDANGNYIIVWHSDLQDGSDRGVYAQLYNADGSPNGGEFLVNSTTAEAQLSPSVAMDDAGNFTVTWMSNLQDGDNYGVYAQQFNASGVAQGPEFLVNTTTTNYQGSPGIAMSASGAFVINWASSGQDPDGTIGIYAQLFDAAANAVGNEFRANTYTTGHQQVSSVSMDAAGNFVITWGSQGQDGSNYGVFGQVFNADGSLRGPEFQANTTTQYSQLYNDVAMLPDGRFVVAYQSANADTSTDLFIQAFNADGSMHGGEIKVNAVSDMDYFPIPSITADASGNFTVVWNNSNDGALSGVFMKRYDWDGNALTGEVQVNTTTAGNQFYPEIVAQPDGGLIVAWSGNGAGDADGIFTQRYGLATDEDGGTASFQLVLESAPTADVVIPISVSDGTEGSVSAGSITFTSGNWNIAQTVTVTGLQDLIADGDQVFSVNIGPATSADPNFNGLDPENLTITNIGTNTPPQITSDGAGASASVSVAENTIAVTTVTANDPDGDTPTLSITGGADQLLFDIDPNTGELTFKDAPNFELPADSNSDNVYVVTVTANDGKGGSDVQTISVTVTDANDAPVAVGDSIVAIEGVPYVAQLTVDDLLLNDSDPDGDTLTVNTTPASGPTNGSLVLNADGTFTYTPNTDFNGADAFTYQVLDGNGGSAQATVNITVQPREVRILFSTQSDVNNSKVPGVASWDAGEVLGIGDPNLSFEPSGSDGSVLPYMDLEQFAASNNMTLNGLHFVSNDITVGGANSIDLQRGDLLFVSENNETMTSNNTLAINAGDVIIFRPTAVDDYSSGTFIHLLDQPGTAMTTGITLIEKDVTIGDVTLTAGGFLFTQQSVVEESSIYYHPADDVGAGTTSGTVQTLISSVDIDVNFNNFVGVMVINEDLYLDGNMVPAGSIVTTLAGGDSFVGDNGVMINNDEIFYLTVHTTTMGSGTTSADATLLFDGGEIGLNNSSKKMNNLTIIEEITPVNTDPEITLTASALSYSEQNPPTVIDAGASLADPDSADFDTGILRVDLTGGTANDRLSINHQGTGAGQVGVSGNSVSYANVIIGSFSGGGSGSEPLVIVFNDNATVAAVQAVMRNVTYENLSPNPSTAQRTSTFTVTDGDGGSSTPVSRNINVISVNDAPVLSGANDLATTNEDAFNNGGTLVSDLVTGSITDTDAGALEGIAVVAVDDTNGSWQYTTDNGANWSAFGAVSANAATLLAADADTRVRFVPDPGWNGTVSNGITFHAWDQSLGANGDTVDLTLVANVSDQFSTVSYANDDGSGVWTSSWTESNDDAAATTGNVRIESGKLHLDNLDGGTAESITRSADLSAAATATLTFDYDGYGAGALDTVAFEISNDGGSSWTLLENVDIVGNVSDSKSYTLEDFTPLTADMQVRISIVQGFDGVSEQINIDNVGIAYAGPGIDGSGAVSLATASSSITVTSVNNAPTMTEWYSEDWNTRKLLSIDAAQVAGDVTDFPMLITFNTDAELAAQALANGDDIIFTAGDGSTLLAHEIEFFDEATGELRAWVKTDLSASVDTDIYMYFGNSSATNQENAAGVWSSNYTGVYHLDQAPDGTAGDIIDSSGSNNHGTSAGGMDGTDLVNGAVGQGLAFDGVNDMIRIPDSTSLDGMNDAATFSLWINWVDAANGDHQIIMTSENRYSGGDGYEWASQGDGDHFFYPDATSPDGNYNIGTNPFTNNNWHHLAVTMDYTTRDVNIYVDGNEMSFFYEGVPSRWTDLSASGDLLFGGNPDRATRYFEGMMDEIRLADVVRSQEWILTEANNQTNPGAFLSVSSSETVLTRDTLTDINEDDFNSPGDTVQSIISSSGSDRIMDDDDGAVEGIAVIAVDDTNGQWQYDANADGSWVAFGSVSDTSAVLLDTAALIRFVPNADYNGPAGDLTFRAWDQTAGVNGNTGIDVSANGGNSAYSSETFGATLNVLPVNDAPVNTVPGAQTVNEESVLNITGISVNDVDGNLATTQVSVTNGNLNVSLVGGATISAGANDSNTLTLSGSQAQINAALASLSYQGNSNFNGSDTLTVLSTDSDGTPLSDSDNVAITVTQIDDAGSFGGDVSAATNEDTATSGTVTFADAADGFTTANFSLNAAATNGVAAIDAAGNWTYTPTANYNGADSFIVEVTDDDGNVETQTINITVSPVDDAGTFGGDVSATTDEDTATAGTVTFADTADGFATPNFTINTVASSGTAAIDAAGNWTYTPDANYNGADSFVVQVTDDDGNVETQTINITVSPVDDAGTFGGDVSATTNEDTATAGTVTFTNTADGYTTNNFALNTAATNGVAAIDAAGNWTYTPNANYNGADSFVVQVTDDDGNIETQVISITVTPVDDVGTFGGDVSATTNEDTATAGTVTFADTADGYTTNNFALNTAATNGVAAIDTAGNWTYTPNANFNGADSFTVQVTDDDGNVETQVISITVIPVDDAALIAGVDTGSIQEDVDVITNNISTSGLLTIADPDTGESIFVAGTITGTYGDLVMQTNGNWTYTADNTQAAIQQLDALESITDTLTVTSFDGTTHNVVITINGSEDAAVITGTTTGSVTEDGTLTSSGALTITDTDSSDTPSFADVGVTAGDNSYGSFEMTAGTWTYTLNNAHPSVQALDVTETLTDTYTFVATDGSSQQVTVTINGAEDAPVFDSTAVTAATEDAAYSYTITTSDVDVEAVTITAPTLPTWLTFVDNGDGTATLSGTPTNAEVGSHNVVLTVSDGSLSSNQNFTIVVANTNDPAVIGGVDTGAVQEDVAVVTNNISTSGTLTITDPDTGESSFQAATINGLYGDLVMQTNGDWTYTADNTQAAIQQLDALESITDTLTVTSFDGTTHNVVITINGSEDAAVISGTTTGSVTEDGTLTSSGTLSISDTDTSDTPGFADVTSTAGDNGYGSFVMTSGTWTYTLDNNNAAVQALDVSETLTDTYTFTATDGSSQQVTVTINGAEDAPVFDSTAVTAATEDAAYSYTITTSDVDVEAVTITAPTLPAWLTFVDNGDGTATLSGTPTNAEVGSHNVVLTVSDGSLSSNQNFTIVVANTNDPAVIGGVDTGAVQEDVAVVADQISTSGTLTITDPDTGESTFQAATINGTYGDLTIDAAGNWTYTADNTQAAIQQLDALESITDTLTVTSFDGTTHNVVITINGSEDNAVIAGSISGGMTEDGTLTSIGTLTISDTDTSDNPVSFVDVSSTVGDNGYGSFEMTSGTWTYTLDNNHAAVQALDVTETLTDTHTFSATDGSIQQVTITIYGAEDAPVFDSTAVTAATEDAAYSYTITTSDVDVEAVTITAPTLPTWLTFVDNGDGTASLTGTPTNAEVGSHNVVLNVSDGTLSSNQSFTIIVGNTNDPAVIGGTDTGAVQEDVGVVANNISASGSMTIADPDAGESSFVAATINGTYGDLVIDSAGNWSYSADNSQISIQALDALESITDTLTVTTFDGTTHDVVITINGSEDAAVSGGTASGSVTEDGSLTTTDVLTITDIDASDNPVNYLDVAPNPGANGYGNFEMTAGTWTYTLSNGHAAVQALDVGETLTDSYTFFASDGSSQLVTVTINGAEDAPTLDNAIADQTATEDAAFNFTFAANTFADLDASDTLTYSATLADSSPLPGWLSFDAATRTFSGTPANADVGPIDIRITADDGSSTVSDTYTLTVLNVDDAPLISGDDTGTVTEDVGVIGGIISTTGSLTIADPDAGESSFQPATVSGSYGDLTIDISGNWIYDANNNQAAIQALDAGQSMIDTLTVSAFDGTTHDIVITINGTEDSAVIGGTAVGAVTEDSALVVSDTLMITDVDSNDNPVSFNDVATTPGSNGYGSFEMTGNTWSYTLNNGHAAVQALDVGETLTDTYTFAASDGSTQVVTVTINGSEDAPLISGTTTGAVSEDGVLAASEMLTISDTDSSDNPISFNDVTPTLGINGYGVFEMSGNTWTYTLNNSHAAVQALDVGETLTDLFTFSASDGSTQIVTITIAGAEDAPTLDNAIADQTATQGAVFSFAFAANTFGDLDTSDTLTYSATLSDSSPLPAWLSFDGLTRTFSGTPGAVDVGAIDIRITADDGSSNVTDTFTLTIDPDNNAPLIGGVDSGQVNEDQSVADGKISTSGALTIADADIGESSFVGSTVKGALGALTIDTDGNWRYSADNGNPEIQALQSGQSITDTLTVTTADGTTHDVVITINGAAEAAPPPPPPVVEPPIVEPPPEAEPPPEEEAETGGGADPVVDEIVRAPQDVTPPPVQEEVDLSSYLQQEEAEADKARVDIVSDKPAIRMVEQPMAQAIQQQAIQQQNLSLGDLSLQVSDDETLNEKYELELLARIDSMHSGMDSDAAQSSADDVEVQIVMGSTASLTAGIVSWVLRGGSLLASFMSTVPLLNRFDPLPILKSREEEEDVEEDSDDDDADTQFRQHQQRVDNMFSGKGSAAEQDGYMNE